MKIIKEYLMSHPSQEFSESPRLERNRGNSIIRYTYETDTGYDWKEIVFLNTIAYHFTAPSAVTTEMVSAYDAVAFVQDSEWLSKVLSNHQGLKGDYKHYVIFFDEYGCYEFISTGFIAD